MDNRKSSLVQDNGHIRELFLTETKGFPFLMSANLLPCLDEEPAFIRPRTDGNS